MSLKQSYFALPNPFATLARWLNPPRHRALVELPGGTLSIHWSARAERRLRGEERPLLAEMQLYFSCVVKKRVLFHTRPPQEALDIVTVNERLQVAFRAVQADSCDPVEFAARFPVRHQYRTLGALRMHPSSLRLDYVEGAWVGEFQV